MHYSWIHLQESSIWKHHSPAQRPSVDPPFSVSLEVQIPPQKPNPSLQPHQPQPSNYPAQYGLGSPHLSHTFSLPWSCSCWTWTTFIHYLLLFGQVFSQTTGPSQSLGWWPHLEGVSLLSLNLTNTSPALFIFAICYVLPTECCISWEWRFLESNSVWFSFVVTLIIDHWIFPEKYWVIDQRTKNIL